MPWSAVSDSSNTVTLSNPRHPFQFTAEGNFSVFYGRLWDGTMTGGSFVSKVRIDGEIHFVPLIDVRLTEAVDLTDVNFFDVGAEAALISTLYDSYQAAFGEGIASGDMSAIATVGHSGQDIVSTRADDLLLVAGGTEVRTWLGDDTIHVDGEGAFVRGMQGDDSLVGGEGDDTLRGGQGIDTSQGGAGNDHMLDTTGDPDTVSVMSGGDGDDSLKGQDGLYALYGDAGNDTLRADEGTLHGGGGDDVLQGQGTLFGNDGDDRLIGEGEMFGGNGGDFISGVGMLDGGTGDDTLLGGGTFSRFSGYDDDILRGGAGDDSLSGMGGWDVLIGGSGVDHLTGGRGDTAFVLFLRESTVGPLGHAGVTGTATIADFDLDADVLWIGPMENTTYDQQDAFDLFMRHASQSGEDIRFDNGESVVIIQNTRLENLELAHFHDGALQFAYDDWSDGSLNVIGGRVGDDTYIGDWGIDWLVGFHGDDLLEGRAGNDTLHGGKGFDTLLGGQGDDTLRGFLDDDDLNGGTGDDILQGREGSDILRGMDGNDRLNGGPGRDVLMGYQGRDRLSGGEGADAFVLFLRDDPDAFAFNQEITGRAVILDFDLDEDVLWIGPHDNGTYTRQEAHDLFTAHAVQDGAHVVFDNGQSVVVIHDTALADLTLDHFQDGSPAGGYSGWADLG